MLSAHSTSMGGTLNTIEINVEINIPMGHFLTEKISHKQTAKS